jgi:hypothetical protein
VPHSEGGKLASWRADQINQYILRPASLRPSGGQGYQGGHRELNLTPIRVIRL